MRRQSWILMTIFLAGFLIKIFSIWPGNTIVGFDQARDFFDARKIVLDHDLRIIGPTAGNNPNLHHGVAYLYYLITPIFLGGGNPAIIAVWNSFFNSLTVVVIYLFAKSLFKNERSAVIASLIIAVSYYYTQYAGWLSNPTATLLTVPVFFYGCWQYYQGKWWGLPLASFFLGLTIQFELFFIYLIPTAILAWLILRPKLPSLKLFFISLGVFLISTLTMILTEIKFHLAGVKSVLFAGNFVGGQESGGNFLQLLIKFLEMRWEAFYLNFWPQNKEFGLYFGLTILAILFYEIIQNSLPAGRQGKEIIKRNLFLTLWLFSPAIMLFIGIHNAPWFLIGRPGAAILMVAWVISKIKPRLLAVLATGLIVIANLQATKDAYGRGQPLLEPDESAILSTQVAVMNYTYQKSGGTTFAIDSVTNPLYINAVWAWNYDWYYKKYGEKPTWLGGDQVHPYNTLAKATGKEKYFFLIIDQTYRIPPIYTQKAVNNLKKKARFIEEKEFKGIKVLMFENLKKG